MLKVLSIGAALSFVLLSSALAQQPRFGACAADVKKVCANISPGQGRIGACIKEHLNDLTDACKTRLSQAAAAAKVCGEDVKKECGSVSGRVRKAACIKKAIAGLGDDCKTAMAGAVARKE